MSAPYMLALSEALQKRSDSINLRDCKLTGLPPQLNEMIQAGLVAVKKLDLQKNKFSNLTDRNFVYLFETLETLILKENLFNEFNLTILKSLTILDLSYNRFNLFPDVFQVYKNFHFLVTIFHQTQKQN